MNDTEKLITAIALLTLAALLYGLCNYTPTAMHHETMNQRAIAAGSWKHAQGYYDYQKFVEANNAQ